MERIHRVEVEMRNVVGNTTQLQKLSLARYDIHVNYLTCVRSNGIHWMYVVGFYRATQ